MLNASRRSRSWAALAAVLLSAAGLAGCGASNEGEELADYFGRVVKPAVDEHDGAFKELKPVFDAKRHRDEAAEIAQDLREKVIAKLEASHGRFVKYKARSPLIAEANKLLADQAELSLTRMKELAHAVERRDLNALKPILDGFKNIDQTMIEVITDLHTLGVKDGVELK